ncbi:MAG: selenoprotein O, partial [Tsuneonella sp.]
LGAQTQDEERDAALVAACEAAMRESGAQPDAFFHRHRGGRNAEGAMADALDGYAPAGDEHPLWDEPAPPTLVIEEVERVWAAIAERDDWQPLRDKIAAIRGLGAALGEPPAPAAHADTRD